MLRWFEEGGNNSDVVISSRVRLARNINGYNFSYKMSDTDAKKLVKNVTDQLKTISPIIHIILTILMLIRRWA